MRIIALRDLATAIWDAGVAGKLLTATSGWLAVSLARDISLVDVLTILLLIGVGLPVIRNRRKDVTIKDLNDALEAKDRRVEELTSDFQEARQQTRQLEQACQHCKTDAAKWQAKYEEVQKYTAKDAVTHFEEMLAEHSEKVAERHAIMLDQGQKQVEAMENITATLKEIDARVRNESNGR